MAVAVDESWNIAKRGDALDDAVGELDTDGIDRELATCEADLAVDPDRSDLRPTADAIRSQLASARRLEEVARDARDRLRRLNAQLNEAVARAVELSWAPPTWVPSSPSAATSTGW